MQIDGYVEGKIEVNNLLRISETGNVVGEILTERLIINGAFEGVCRATYIEVLSSGRVTGTVYSDNLSIETGGKFMGVTKPPEEQANEQNIIEHNEDEYETKDLSYSQAT
ncbi:polymer-forming cytoskeletal protein [Marinomonas sp. 5E14-1]|uniref:bactofilin family protein n=1 Tax=Marinomonas sp. 5E14-1 TaxID=3153922 RepID=UPI003265A38B